VGPVAGLEAVTRKISDTAGNPIPTLRPVMSDYDDEANPAPTVIKVNSIRIYLLGNLTAQRPITKLAGVKYEKTTKQMETKYKNKASYIIKIIIIISIIVTHRRARVTI
jgi:hypothetical protein